MPVSRERTNERTNETQTNKKRTKNTQKRRETRKPHDFAAPLPTTEHTDNHDRRSPLSSFSPAGSLQVPAQPSPPFRNIRYAYPYKIRTVYAYRILQPSPPFRPNCEDAHLPGGSINPDAWSLAGHRLNHGKMIHSMDADEWSLLV